MVTNRWRLTTVSIIHGLLRRILAVCAPGTGRRRAGANLAGPVPAYEPAPAPAAARLPAHRSPYGLPTLLDGRAAASVRPYVLAAEFGIHPDQPLIGAERAA